MALALGTKILPGALGSDGDLARLAGSGGLLERARPGGRLRRARASCGWPGTGGRPAWAMPVAGAGLALVIVTVLLTYSRGGVLSPRAGGRGVTVAFLPAPLAAAQRPRGRRDRRACPPPPYALHGPAAVTPTRCRSGLREGAGARPGLAPRRRHRRGGRARPRLVSASSPGRLDRPGRAPGRWPWGWRPARSSPWGRWPPAPRRAAGRATAAPSSAARAATPSPTTPAGWSTPRGNQRKAWWEEAWRGFEASPGRSARARAASPLVHLQERSIADDALNTREAHDIVLRLLSGTGDPRPRAARGAGGGRDLGGPARGRRSTRTRDRAAPRDPRGLRPPGGGRLVVGDPGADDPRPRRGRRRAGRRRPARPRPPAPRPGALAAGAWAPCRGDRRGQRRPALVVRPPARRPRADALADEPPARRDRPAPARPTPPTP